MEAIERQALDRHITREEPDARPRHTPGPWTRVYEERFRHDNSAGVRAANNLYIAAALDRNSYDLDEEVEANARLIAAAPDFLAACTHEEHCIPALDWLSALLNEVDAHFKSVAGEDDEATYTAFRASCKLLLDLRAAVKKAEGR
jgi:hypothetical protein